MAACVKLERNPHGKPLIPASPEGIFTFGHLIRITEELILDQFRKGMVSGTTHTCIGQELCQMAVVRALNQPADRVFSNHRNHGHFLTYSADFLGLVAEVMGREAGVCGGRGGSQHIAFGHFHSNGVQGGMTAIGAGEALALKWQADGSIAAVITGDGTLGEGLLYEAMNLASVWRVPLLFVVEHNHIAQTTPTAETTGGSIAARGEAFGLTSWQLSDTSPDFFEQVESVVASVRSSGAPGFLVIDTQRLGPHSKGDDLREEAEMEAIRRRDPLDRLGDSLGRAARSEIEDANREFLESVRVDAEASPLARCEQPARSIFAAQPVSAPPLRAAAPGSVRQSITRALRNILVADPKAVLLGEDLHDPYGGAFKATSGLSSEFPSRVISMPISEAAIVGAGNGLAMAGYRPICEVMFADFVGLAMDQLYNHSVKFPGLFPNVKVPLVVRTPSGGRRGYGPTHSQSPENILTSVPGLTVLFPSHRHDAGGLLERVVAHWPYPVVFMEHKLLYGMEQAAGDYRELPPDDRDFAARLFPTLERGSSKADFTVITYGGMLPVVEETVAQLEEQEELQAQILVPSLLSPLPGVALLRALAGARRVAIVEESHSDFGVGAEIAATLMESGFQGKVIRIGTPPVPIPSARSLEQDVIPGKSRIAARILEMF